MHKNIAKRNIHSLNNRKLMKSLNHPRFGLRRP